MGEEVKPFVIKKTQDSLGKFLKRPPLTEKLLKKPPFRFLHDIITAVIRQYGLMDGLFTADEMVSDNVKDKESKIAFLQKVIDTMKLVTGSNLTVRPSKIVAGQEADKTNELLQAIAKALDKKISSKKAVDQVLGKSKEGPSNEAKSSKSKDSKEVAVNGKEKPSRRKVGDKQQSTVKERSKVKETKESTSRRSKERKTEKEKSPDKVAPVENGIEEMVSAPAQELPSLGAAPVEEIVPSFEPSAPELTPEPNQNSLPTKPEPEVTTELGVVPSSAPDVAPPPPLEAVTSSPPVLGSDQPLQASPEASGSNEASRAPTAIPASPVPVARPASVRPGSARPRPLTARPAAPRLKERVVRPAVEDPQPEPVISTNLIPDSAAVKPEEDDSTFIVEEAQPVIQDLEVPQEEPSVPLVDSGEPQGHLVTQILGTQRELEDQDVKDAQQGEDWQWSGRDATRKEVKQLREAVQSLVRAANPLARLLDFLQEDMEAMQMELEHWQSENIRLREEIAKQKQVAEESLQPLHKQLAELKLQEEQQKQVNASLKAAVIDKDSKLMAMLLSD